MAKKKKLEQPAKKDTHVYLPIGARAVVYPYEMVDNAFAYALLIALLLVFICLTFGLGFPEFPYNPIVYWSAAGLELLTILILIAYHTQWYDSLRKSDEFTLLYDTTSGDIVCYLHTTKEKRIPAKDIIEVDSHADLFFRPFSRMLNLLSRDLGHVKIVYRKRHGKRRLVVRDFSKPGVAAIRLNGVLKELRRAEELKQAPSPAPKEESTPEAKQEPVPEQEGEAKTE